MIKIKGKEYRLKYTLRGLFVYEQITGVTFSPDKSLNVFVLIFCFLLVNNEDFRLSFDEFTDILDDEPETVKDIYRWMEEENKRIGLVTAENPAEGDKKKVSRSGKSTKSSS